MIEETRKQIEHKK